MRLRRKIGINLLGLIANIAQLWRNIKRKEPIKIKLTRIKRGFNWPRIAYTSKNETIEIDVQTGMPKVPEGLVWIVVDFLVDTYVEEINEKW